MKLLQNICAFNNGTPTNEIIFEMHRKKKTYVVFMQSSDVNNSLLVSQWFWIQHKHLVFATNLDIVLMLLDNSTL